MSSELWITKAGSPERGEKWKKIADSLNLIESPRFEVNHRSTRDRFQFLFEKRKAKNREEERASGISPDMDDIDKLLDELIELFQTANLEHENVTKQKADKAAINAEKGLEMRRMSMETMGESSKRQARDDGRGKEKRARRAQNETFEYLNEKLKFDTEWRRKEFELKERKLAEKSKSRESKDKDNEFFRAHIERRFDAICNQMKRQNEILVQISKQLQDQNALIRSLTK